MHLLCKPYWGPGHSLGEGSALGQSCELKSWCHLRVKGSMDFTLCLLLGSKARALPVNGECLMSSQFSKTGAVRHPGRCSVLTLGAVWRLCVSAEKLGQ